MHSDAAARVPVVAPVRQTANVNRKQRRARDKRAKKGKTAAAQAQSQAALSLLMMVLAECQGTVMVTAENVVKARTVPMLLKASPQQGGGMLIELLRQDEAQDY